MWLTLRSLVWTVLFPGVFAGYVPWRFFGVRASRVVWSRPDHLVGVGCVAVGATLLGACIIDFARRGRGTLSPVDPPTHLVVAGLYRYVRNPMYLSVATIVMGEYLVAPSQAFGIYWAVWFLSANVFVVFYEEPNLRRRFGASYDEYTRQVGRWIPRLRTGR